MNYLTTTTIRTEKAVKNRASLDGTVWGPFVIKSKREKKIFRENPNRSGGHFVLSSKESLPSLNEVDPSERIKMDLDYYLTKGICDKLIKPSLSFNLKERKRDLDRGTTVAIGSEFEEVRHSDKRCDDFANSENKNWYFGRVSKYILETVVKVEVTRIDSGATTITSDRSVRAMTPNRAPEFVQ